MTSPPPAVRVSSRRDGTTTGTLHPPTSHLAAARVLPKTGTQRALILAALQARPANGYTDVEIQHLLDLGPNSERPRRVELVRAGWVRDTGAVRLHHGEQHIVWGVAP